MFFKLAIAAYVTLTVTPLIIEYFLRRKTKRIPEQYDKGNCKCMFTSFKMNGECKQHIIDKVPCNENCALMILRYIVDLISSADKSVSVCMYLITCREIAEAIINCHKAGKRVRVIVDERMYNCLGNKAKIFQRNGANYPLNSMKFLLIMKCMF